MAVIESLVSKSAENELKALNANLEQTRKTIIEISKTQLDFNGGTSVSSFADFNNKMKESISIRQRTEAQIERMRLAELKLQQARERAFANYEKNLQKETQGLQRAETAYNRIQASVNILIKTYQDLAIRKELGSTLTAKEEAQLLSLTKRLNMYQSALKKVDSDVQKYQRNVGNYASGFNPLNNAIGQLSRELPNLGQSFQIFALSISNNIGALQDAISGIVAQNKILAAQGEPVKSVFSQIISSVLSLQTALYVGIALFVAYSKEIGTFISNLFSSAKAFDAVKESQKALNESTIEGRKNAQQELIALKSNLAIAKDVNLSYKERLIAVENIQRQYPFYFENLTKEQILAGQTAKAENELTEAILSRAKAQAAISRITENQSKIIDLEERRLEVIDKLSQAEDRLSAARNRVNAASASETAYQTEINALQAVNSQKSKLSKIEKEIADITAVNTRLTTYAIQNQKESIGLDYQKEKSQEKVNKRRKEAIALEGLEPRGADSVIRNLEEQIKRFEDLRVAVSKNGDEYRNYTKIIDALKLQLQSIVDLDSLLRPGAEENIKNLEEQAEKTERLAEAQRQLQFQTQQFVQNITGGFFDQAGLGSLNFFTQITSNGLTAFETLMAGADEFKEKFAITFKGITDVAKEAFEFINQQSEARFEAQLNRLQKEKDIALQFAGDSASAREEIERQYDERQREIKRRQAEQQKQNALFNILINTAQGIVSALASTPPNVPLSIAIGAIGAVQAGIVASQQIPEFWKGTDNAPQGWALVDEKRPEVHTDSKGNIKSFGSEKGANYRYLNRGDKIYKSREEYFNRELHNILKDNGISFHNEMAKSGILSNIPSFERGITAQELESVIRRTQPKNEPSSQFRIKKTDVKQFWADMLSETENKNNRYSSRGKKV